MRRQLQVACALALLAGGILISARLDEGLIPAGPPAVAGSAVEPPMFRIEHRRGILEITGNAASADHEAALRQVIAEQFGGARLRVELRPGIILPDRWDTATLQLLHAVAATESGVAVMDTEKIVFRGVAADSDALAARLEFLRKNIPAGISIDEDVVLVDASASLSALCRGSLASALTEPVAFRQSSAEIRTSSLAILDKVIDIANDCRDSRIAITGHSDASGDETWNRNLSLARAQAVADYIIRGGIEPERLIVTGLGSTQPVADNSTAQGRSRNRRIEFELR